MNDAVQQAAYEVATGALAKSFNPAVVFFTISSSLCALLIVFFLAFDVTERWLFTAFAVSYYTVLTLCAAASCLVGWRLFGKKLIKQKMKLMLEDLAKSVRERESTLSVEDLKGKARVYFSAGQDKLRNIIVNGTSRIAAQSVLDHFRINANYDHEEMLKRTKDVAETVVFYIVENGETMRFDKESWQVVLEIAFNQTDRVMEELRKRMEERVTEVNKEIEFLLLYEPIVEMQRLTDLASEDFVDLDDILIGDRTQGRTAESVITNCPESVRNVEIPAKAARALRSEDDFIKKTGELVTGNLSLVKDFKSFGVTISLHTLATFITIYLIFKDESKEGRVSYDDIESRLLVATVFLLMLSLMFLLMHITMIENPADRRIEQMSELIKQRSIRKAKNRLEYIAYEGQLTDSTRLAERYKLCFNNLLLLLTNTSRSVCVKRSEMRNPDAALLPTVEISGSVAFRALPRVEHAV